MKTIWIGEIVMHGCIRYSRILVLFFLFVLVSFVETVWSAPVTEKQVQQVVSNWLSREKAPLGAAINKTLREITPYTDADGNVVYFIVFLEPKGIVIVSGDDLVEPIIGFVVDAVSYDPSDTNPLGALVNKDLSGRVQAIREQEKKALVQGGKTMDTPLLTARAKWKSLEGSAGQNIMIEKQLTAISDIRIPPLVQSKWSQTDSGGSWINGEWVGARCYNYYTPNNYPCGCTGTAMAQLMRYHRYPTIGVGTPSFSISVDGSSENRSLRGGDGNGGSYDWDNMPLVPDDSTTEKQRQAIGALTHDLGVSVRMDYTAESSGAWPETSAIINTFKYSNAIMGYNQYAALPAAPRNTMINTNLDAALPVIITIHNATFGHAVIGDGYGYNMSTLYHHVNMGWAGYEDAWYNLPTVDDSYYGFNIVDAVVYNVYLTGSGEVISGRVTDCVGTPLSGVAITAMRNSGGKFTATTNSQGIYALAQIPSSSTYTIHASKDRFTFPEITVSTQTSLEMKSSTGNYWGANFSSKEKLIVSSPWLFLLLQDH